MTRRMKRSGIRNKYLKYTAALLILALMLSSIGAWLYVRREISGAIIDKYEFMTERKGLALDRLFQETDGTTESVSCMMMSRKAFRHRKWKRSVKTP